MKGYKSEVEDSRRDFNQNVFFVLFFLKLNLLLKKVIKQEVA